MCSLPVEATPLDPLAQVLQLLVDRLAMTGVTLASSLRQLRALVCRLGQLGGDRLFLDSILETVLPDLRPIVFAQPVLAEHLAHALANLFLPLQTSCGDHPAHLLQFPGGGLQQAAALALPSSGQLRIPTGDESLAGQVRMGELEQVALIEESPLDGPALHQLADGLRAERRDPVGGLSRNDVKNYSKRARWSRNR